MDQLLALWIALHPTSLDDNAVDAIVSDSAFDMLIGSSGADWFIVSVNDQITDQSNNDKDENRITIVS